MIYFDPKSADSWIDVEKTTPEEWYNFWSYVVLIGEEKIFSDICVSNRFVNWWFSNECRKIAEEYNQIKGE